MRRALALFAVPVVLAACGGDDGNRLSKEEFVERADRICARVNERLEQTEQPQTMDELVTVLEQGLTDVNAAVEDLGALEPPEDLDDDVDAWLADVDAASEQIEKARDAAKSGDEEALADALEEGTEINDRGNRRARELGLTECAEE